jgi:hypothetical protein
MRHPFDAWRCGAGRVSVTAKSVRTWSVSGVPAGDQFIEPHRLLVCLAASACSRLEHRGVGVGGGGARGGEVQKGEAGRSEDAGAGSPGGAVERVAEQRGTPLALAPCGGPR